MDAFLSAEAQQTLKALCLLLPKQRLEGFLMGHKRGHRYFVEKALPSNNAFFLSLEKYYLLHKLYEGKILGFFSFQEDGRKTKNILKPFALGKLFLNVRLGQNGRMSFKSYVVDYHEKFFLLPVRFKIHKKGKK